MSGEDSLQLLVEEVAHLTGAQPPDRSVSVADEALRDDALCFVGLIGGKDVGKTSLVNALVGRELSAPAGFGRGTDEVIAYCHASVEPRVRRVLEREAPGRHRIVTHDSETLSRQVLLDLPDIDSCYQQHVALTRRMLPNMLFPIWIQSVEKYADATPRRLLQAVAEGNDPGNFQFVLNKVDQVADREGPAAVEALRRDYAARLADALSLPTPPPVHAVSATQPDRFDLPGLRAVLMRPRSAESLESAARGALTQRNRTLLRWIDDQGLRWRRDALRSLEQDARERVRGAVVGPLLAELLPAALSSASFAWSVSEDASRTRLARWPIVRVLDALLYPLTGLVRRNVAPRASAVNVLSLAPRLQGVFLRLEQLHPALAGLYAPRRPWETMESEQALSALQRDLDGAVALLRGNIVAEVGRCARWTAPWRWLLTVGAAAWFPFVQPLLEIVLTNSIRTITPDLAIWIVRVLGASYLLQSVGFLVLWYLALWAWIRLSIHRRVASALRRALSDEHDAGPLAVIESWGEQVLAPIASQATSLDALLERIDAARGELDQRRPRDP